jgi:hypothetical protein
LQRINDGDAVGWMDADVDDRKKKKVVFGLDALDIQARPRRKQAQRSLSRAPALS